MKSCWHSWHCCRPCKHEMTAPCFQNLKIDTVLGGHPGDLKISGNICLLNLRTKASPGQAQKLLNNVLLQGTIFRSISGTKTRAKNGVAELGLDSCSYDLDAPSTSVKDTHTHKPQHMPRTPTPLTQPNPRQHPTGSCCPQAGFQIQPCISQPVCNFVKFWGPLSGSIFGTQKWAPRFKPQ